MIIGPTKKYKRNTSNTILKNNNNKRDFFFLGSFHVKCGINRSEMLKIKFQIFMRLIFFLENMNAQLKIDVLTFLVKKLEPPEIAFYLLHFPTFLTVVFNAN